MELPSKIPIKEIGAAAVLLASGMPSVAEAATCKVGIRVTAYEYIDMYHFTGVGTQGRIDPEDVRTSLAKNFSVELRNNKDDSKPADTKPVKVIKDKEGHDIAQAEVSTTKDCDGPIMDDKPTARVWVNTAQSCSDREEKDIKDKVWREMVDGRAVYDIDAIRRFAQTQMPNSDPRKQQILNGLNDSAIVKNLNEKAKKAAEEAKLSITQGCAARIAAEKSSTQADTDKQKIADLQKAIEEGNKKLQQLEDKIAASPAPVPAPVKKEDQSTPGQQGGSNLLEGVGNIAVTFTNALAADPVKSAVLATTLGGYLVWRRWGKWHKHIGPVRII